MLIRSQNRRQLIPLERFTIGITKDNYVCATSNMYASPIEISAGVLGKYSSEEKSMKVLDMICDFYTEHLEEMTNDQEPFVRTVFYMPQDDEVWQI